MMLEMIQQDHGVELASVVADMCIHYRSNTREAPQTSAFSVALSSRNPHLIAAVTFMNENVEDPVTMDEIAEEAGLSRRQLERLFVKYLSKPPMKLYTDLRLARAINAKPDLRVARLFHHFKAQHALPEGARARVIQDTQNRCGICQAHAAKPPASV